MNLLSGNARSITTYVNRRLKMGRPEKHPQCSSTRQWASILSVVRNKLLGPVLVAYAISEIGKRSLEGGSPRFMGFNVDQDSHHRYACDTKFSVLLFALRGRRRPRTPSPSYDDPAAGTNSLPLWVSTHWRRRVGTSSYRT
jgi:hypothetical protein